MITAGDAGHWLYASFFVPFERQRADANGARAYAEDSRDPATDQGWTGQAVFVHLVNAPVREVLNAIVPAHGDVWWHVSYRESPPIYRHCTIRLNGFDNWSIADAARVPPPPMRPR